MEVCEHHKPFKELTSSQNGTLLLGTHHSFEKKTKKQNKTKKTVVSLATFVALQVWYGIPNERVPKFPLNSG